jgi:hypothetical protein
MRLRDQFRQDRVVKVNNVFIQISTSNPSALRAFYADIVGLEPAPMGFGAPDAGGTTLGFDEHSDVSGSAREPARILINLAVDDIDIEEAPHRDRRWDLYL